MWIREPLTDFVDREEKDIVRTGDNFLFDHDGRGTSEKASEGVENIDDIGTPDFAFSSSFACVGE